MPDAVIVGAVRTPIGTARKGTLADTSALDLAEVVVAEAVRRSELPADRIDDIVLAESGYGGGDIARHFASVPVAACQELGIDEDKVNTRGGGCSLGHPIAASGARMLTILVHQLRGSGGGLAIAAMCAGGGRAGAVLIEVA
jgi:acetyl-CoA C-acetyltransferase